MEAVSMKYLNTTTLNCQIYTVQRDKLDELKETIEKEYNIKIPLSELVRRALDVGIPAIAEDHTFAIELIG